MIAGKFRLLTLLMVCLALTLAVIRRGALPQSFASHSQPVSSLPARDTVTMSIPVEIVETGKAAERREISVVIAR